MMAKSTLDDSKTKNTSFPKIVISKKLRKMVKIKREKSKSKLVCEKCDVNFANWWEIREHWISSGHKAPEQCRWCSKRTFTLQSHLCKQHWNIASMCTYCGQLFMFQEDLEKHLLYHDKTQYRCFQCGRRRKNEDLLNQHMYNHFIYEKYGCNVCEKRFKKKKNMEKHLRVIHLICQYCGKKCNDNEDYKAHVVTHDDLKCTFCKKIFSQKCRLKYHYQLKHGHQDFYKCTICFQRFVTKGRLMEHMKLRHSGKGKFSCKICDAPFLYWQQYIIHFERVHGKPCDPKSFKCSFCDFSTDSKCKLQWHVEKVSGTGFFCKKCQIQMDCKGIYDKHMVIHDGEQVWTCDFCCRSFNSDNILKHHVSLCHREEMIAQNPRGYPCLVEGCDRYYSLKNSLSRHMRRHHSESPDFGTNPICAETTVVCHSPLLREGKKRQRICSTSSEDHEEYKPIKEKSNCTDNSEVSSDADGSSSKKDLDDLKSDSVDQSIITEVNVYYCNTCSKFWFAGESQFRRHMRTHVKKVWEEKCSTCNMILDSPEEAAKHYVEDHLKVEFVH
uniref:C2H2-type domain-containing protein n=2 Tax=Homalodisca liturata TaxID=320908 RepID=A0A1B6H750_9HEMI